MTDEEEEGIKTTQSDEPLGNLTEWWPFHCVAKSLEVSKARDHENNWVNDCYYITLEPAPGVVWSERMMDRLRDREKFVLMPFEECRGIIQEERERERELLKIKSKKEK